MCCSRLKDLEIHLQLNVISEENYRDTVYLNIEQFLYVLKGAGFAVWQCKDWLVIFCANYYGQMIISLRFKIYLLGAVWKLPAVKSTSIPVARIC